MKEPWQKVASVGFWKGVKNASAFEFKRKYVLSETQVRLG